MTSETRISLIGAGSLVFTGSFLRAMCQADLPRESAVTISLIDRDVKKLDTMHSIATKIVDHYERKKPGLKVKLEKTTDRRESFQNADFAMQTVSVGGAEAARLDGSIPKKYGIMQVIGDTVGPGGLMAGLRQIPVAVEIANDLADVSPDALFINFSNPTTPLVRSVLRETKARMFGMCTSILGFVIDMARVFGVSTEEMSVHEAGINHFTWVTHLGVRDRDGIQEFDDIVAKANGKAPFDEYSLCLDLYRLFGRQPVPGDRHIAEYFPKVYLSKGERERFDIPVTPERTIYSEERRRPILDAMSRAADGSMPISEFLQQHFLEEESSESVKVIEAVALGRKRFVSGVNVKNDGLLSDVPDWAVVEVPALIDSRGVHPLGQQSLTTPLTGIINERVFYYETQVDAALEADKDLAVQALMLDGYVDSELSARSMLEEMLGAESIWLPGKWAGRSGA